MLAKNSRNILKVCVLSTQTLGQKSSPHLDFKRSHGGRHPAPVVTRSLKYIQSTPDIRTELGPGKDVLITQYSFTQLKQCSYKCSPDIRTTISSISYKMFLYECMGKGEFWPLPALFLTILCFLSKCSSHKWNDLMSFTTSLYLRGLAF